jgi:hypothetical protein
MIAKGAKKPNFYDTKKEENLHKSRKPVFSEENDRAIVTGGSFSRPNPHAEGKARDAAKKLLCMAKKAAAFGARNAAFTAYNAAETLARTTGTDSDVMKLAENGRIKAKDVKRRALAAAKAVPPKPKSDHASRMHTPFNLKGHVDEESYTHSLMPLDSFVLYEDEDEAYETV